MNYNISISHPKFLQAIISQMPDDVQIFLEIKNVNNDFPSILLDLLEKYDIDRSRITVLCFNGNALKNMGFSKLGFKTILPACLTPKKDDPSQAEISVDELIAILKDLDVSGVSANVPACLADREYIKKVQDAGFEFHVWTVDSPEYAKQLQAVGVDHITTNCPSVLYQALTEADD